jgi:ribose 1,5-bisphosphokinase
LAEKADEMPGKLIYLIGPSGSGKDSLIDAARKALTRCNVHVVRRVITRSAESKGEQALGVSPAAFEHMLTAGEFAMHWAANGLQYGIPKLVVDQLAAGASVLVNGSRAYLPEAVERFPNLLPIMLTVDRSVLRERLAKRGRESAEEIEQRLARNDQLIAEAKNWERGVVRITLLDNSSSLATTVTALLEVLARHGISAEVGRT